MINTNNIEKLIKKKALELGYEACGIIKVDEMKGYAARLNENVEIFPEVKPFYEQMLYPYAVPQKSHEWAKSIIICVSRYGKYKLPANISSQIGKHYWFDARLGKNTEEYNNRILFDTYLNSLGLKTFRDSRFGTTACRWAAQKAGLGIIRKNNFFYTKSGSWVVMDSWLVDKEMELIDTPPSVKPCPNDCTKCQDACKTKALTKPYAMNALKCITYLTCFADDLPPEELREKIGGWIYGCDACQDACPMNKGCLSGEEDFPGISKVAEYMSLQSVFNIDDKAFREIIQPNFWYIGAENRWKWKANAIIAMANNFEVKYEKYLKGACDDEHEKVREIARWACAKLGI